MEGMDRTIGVSLLEFVLSVADTIDAADTSLATHHKRVAYFEALEQYRKFSSDCQKNQVLS